MILMMMLKEVWSWIRSSRRNSTLALAFIVALAIGGAWTCSGFLAERRAQREAEFAQARAKAEELKRAIVASEAASRQRAVDEANTAALQGALADATANLPDAVPSARRRLRACQQLRNQGVDVTELPECR